MEETLLANRYKVLEELGRGGMGIVWKVYDTLEHREIALKQFFRKTMQSEETMKTVAGRDTRLTVTGAEVREPLGGKNIFATTAAQTKRATLTATASPTSEVELQFKQEFYTMVKLKHPNTVNVYDFGGLENGDDYITMEIVSGRELRDILKERQLNIPEVYRILIQTAQVLNFIHSRLLVHRDIKPDNIRITPEGNVKMMDFGLMDQMGLPSSGEITGTPLYMPPEVTKGGVIDARSDLYSLGIMAYELATGKPPFLGKTILEIIKKHIEETPLSPRQIRADVPEELEKVISRLIAKEPDARYQTTAELINDLVKLSGEKVSVETLEQRKSYLNCSELIGREGEMRELKELFALTKSGKGQSIFVAAPAGTGKSRLIQEFQLYIQLEEVPFTQGNCFQQGMIAYQPLAKAFKPLLPLTSKNVMDRYGSVLVKVIPELKDKGYSRAPDLEEYAEKARLFESVTGWLKEVSRVQPLVIYIEDLHWSDIPSLDLLNACIRELSSFPVMILTSFRDDEVEPTSRIFQTVEENLTKVMKLSTLNAENVGILISKMLGRIELTEDFTEHIYTVTGGNPFFVSETMRILLEEEQLKLERGRWILPADVSALELPPSIEATILRRLKLLSSEALEIARIAAVVARNLDLTFLKTLSGLEDEQLFNILDELIERQFMKTEGKLYTFTHDRVRETLYAQLEEATKKEIHEKAANIIEMRFADNKEPVINELAYHFSHGLNKVKAVDYLVKAGDIAWMNKDFFRATKSLKEALEILDTIDYPNKKTLMFHLRDKLEDSAIWTDPALCSAVCERQFKELNNLVSVKRIVRVMRVIFKTVDMLPKKIGLRIKEKLTKQPPKEKIDWDFSSIILYMVRVHGWGALAEFFKGNPKRTLELIEQVDSYLPDLNGLGYSAVNAGFATALIYLGQTKTVLNRVKHALDNMATAKRLVGLKDWFYKYVYGCLFFLMNLRCTTLGKNFDHDSAAYGLQYCEQENFLDLVWFYKCLDWEWLSWRGLYKEFQKESDVAQEISRKLGRPPTQEQWFYGYKTRIEVLLHNYEKAVESVEKLCTLGQRTGTNYVILQGEMYKAFLTFVEGKKEKGINQMRQVVKSAKESNLISAPDAMGLLAQMYIEVQDEEQARVILSQAEVYWNENLEEPSVVAQARVYLLRSELMRRKKEFVKAQDILKEILKISEETSNPLLKGWFYEGMAKINLDLTQYNDAKNNLQEAEKIYEELGAERKKREVAELLRTIKE